jgi:hypothetical protein
MTKETKSRRLFITYKIWAHVERLVDGEPVRDDPVWPTQLIEVTSLAAAQAMVGLFEDIGHKVEVGI